MTAKIPTLTREWLHLKYHIEGLRLVEVAAEAGCCKSAVTRAMDREGVPRRDERTTASGGRNRISFDIERAIQLYAEGRPGDEIGASIGLHGGTVLRRLAKAGVAIRKPNDTKKGRAAHNRIELDAQRIRAEYAKPKATYASVGALFGVSHVPVMRTLWAAGVPAKPCDRSYQWGSGNPNWKDSITAQQRERKRDSYQQTAWRKKIYARDRHTCQRCGHRWSDLNAHHIEDHATSKGNRWDLANGITLCAPCHRAFHKAYGYTGVNRAMLEEYLAESAVTSRR